MLQVIEAHLREFPHEWEWDRFTVTNRQQRLCIWIANQDYGLTLADGVSWEGCPQIKLSRRWRKRFWRVVSGSGAPNRAAQIVERFKEREPARSNVVQLHGTNG
jgi:hypothetical protein